MPQNTVPKSLKITLVIAFWGTILVILAGSIVRTTGSGLGCPDWPHCFGKWIPPTSIEELPLDYKTRFQIQGKEIADFSAFKTWVEYINRLVGVLLGMVLVVLAGLAIAARKRLTKRVFWGSLGTLLLVILQGGIGAVVVATHLHGQTITLHMALALALAVWLSRLQLSSDAAPRVGPSPSRAWWRLAGVVYALTIMQLVLGTEVRKSIDHLVHDFVLLPRVEWALHLEWTFLVHRTLSLVFALMATAWYWRSFKEGLPLRRHFAVLGALVFLGIFTGVVLRELGFPAWAQPTHLVLGTLVLVQVDRIFSKYR
ncbi:MAG TPA: COX15/CtaA family protein [Bdellovibrionota bacterium]|jgi:cytochrome c oxidase assembly protein subunit 15|nr:COX15/CtaA family protein [Bdellovibrionota bacterium]